MNLILFTSYYPYEGSTEQTFLKEEIKRLSNAFETIILIPRRRASKIVLLPSNVIVEIGYAEFLEKPIKLFLIPKIIFSPLLYKEILRYPWLLISPSSLFRLMAFLVGGYLTQRWLLQWMKKNNINHKESIFYTYWFDHPAFGIGLTKRFYPNLKLVSRVHGYDLYPERYSPAYLPLRHEALEMTDLIFPDSATGRDYLVKQYPKFEKKIELSRLGVAQPGFITLPSSDGVLRMVSCSLIVPVKRVNLLLEALQVAAQIRPHQQFEWHHFGNGELRENLQTLAGKILTKNARAYFPGYESNEVLMNFYQSNPIDVFLNVSASEGTAVSIMEAASCGIPIIATAVGGNQEIVTPENGWLLPANPSPKEIADALFYLIDNPQEAFQKRQGSITIWRRQYHNKTNFDLFIHKLKKLLLDS